MQKINIIGCGYIGKKMARALAEKNLPANCFVLSEQSKVECAKHNFQVQQFDLDEPGLNLHESSKQAFDHSVVAYLAPPPGVGKIDTRMANFISMLERLPVAPQKIVLISTTGIYGDCKGEWIDEQWPVNPQADRAYRRLSAEAQLQKYCKKMALPCVVFRVPGIYSADKLPVKRITSGEPIVREKDSGYTNRIHADDLVSFCIEALTVDVEAGVYNCCDGHPSTMNDYFMSVADALKLARPEEISLQQAQQELSAGMLSYLAESKRINNEKLLGNFQTVFKYPNLESGLQNIKSSG